MSEYVTVTQEIDVDVVVDYVKCEECGKPLEFTLDKGTYGCLQITVERCTCCDIPC